MKNKREKEGEQMTSMGCRVEEIKAGRGGCWRSRAAEKRWKKEREETRSGEESDGGDRFRDTERECVCVCVFMWGWGGCFGLI